MIRRIFEAVIGIVLLVVAFVLAIVFQQIYARGVEQQSLPVPIASIGPYTILTENMFEWKDFPRALIGGYATDLGQITGRISTSTIPAGLPIPLSLVSEPQAFRLADPSLEVVSIPITPTSAAGGQIRTGERVNIYRLYIPAHEGAIVVGELKAESTARVTLIAEDIPVVLVLGGDGSIVGRAESGQRVTAQILLLAVTPEQLKPILNLIADTKAGALMWITLAPIKS